ncbi:hypothetical protein [Nitrosophilus alvini]|uniref:hypothetical protein n=1 Tax=Nitrosophilus alvini TaxID=2714855 RepID=UPI00190A8FB3|nr:hypothetical protein [Nitrosophilus alvini]
MRRSAVEVLISFLLGISWALALLSALFAFDFFYPFGLFTAIAGAIFGAFFWLVLIIFLEIASLQIDKYRELKQQTKLLSEIKDRLSNEKLSDI